MALHSFALGIEGVIVTNLYIQKVCRVNLNYSPTVCDNIVNYEEEQNKVQVVVSTLELYSTYLSSIPYLHLHVPGLLVR